MSQSSRRRSTPATPTATIAVPPVATSDVEADEADLLEQALPVPFDDEDRLTYGRQSGSASAAQLAAGGKAAWPSGQCREKSHQRHDEETVAGKTRSSPRRPARPGRRRRPRRPLRRSTRPGPGAAPASRRCGRGRPPHHWAGGGARPARTACAAPGQRPARRGPAPVSCARRSSSGRAGRSCSRRPRAAPRRRRRAGPAGRPGRTARARRSSWPPSARCPPARRAGRRWPRNAAPSPATGPASGLTDRCRGSRR